MDTINTIITNFQTLSHAHIDWSLNAGPIWLAFMAVCIVIGMVMAGVAEVRQERRLVRQALYRQAEHAGYVRGLKRSFHGFQETV